MPGAEKAISLAEIAFSAKQDERYAWLLKETEEHFSHGWAVSACYFHFQDPWENVAKKSCFWFN